MRPSLNIIFFAGFLGLLAATLVIAYAGGPPDVLGHSPEEVDFHIESYSQDCSASGASSCVAECPAPPVGFAYKVVSGSCVSANALYILSQGGCNGSVCGPTQNTYSCTDNSHVAGKPFRATIFCLKGGA